MHGFSTQKSVVLSSTPYSRSDIKMLICVTRCVRRTCMFLQLQSPVQRLMTVHFCAMISANWSVSARTVGPMLFSCYHGAVTKVSHICGVMYPIFWRNVSVRLAMCHTITCEIFDLKSSLSAWAVRVGNIFMTESLSPYVKVISSRSQQQKKPTTTIVPPFVERQSWNYTVSQKPDCYEFLA